MRTDVRRALRTAFITGGLVVAGASAAHALLSDTGWTPWGAGVAVCLIALGLGLRRGARTRRSTTSRCTHPALLNQVPTQRGEPRLR